MEGQNMRLIFGLVLLVGLALAGGAVMLAQSYIGTYEQALEEEREKQTDSIDLVEVFVASRDMAFGETISPDDAVLVKWPRDNIPAGVFHAKNPINAEGDDMRVTLRAFVKNEVFLSSNVSKPGADAGLTSRLQKGQRAMTIEVDVSSGVSGFLRPGDRVDVYWTGRPPQEGFATRQGDVTRLIESGLRLIAIDQMSGDEAAAQATIAQTVTVAATPQQVAALTQAQSTGRLTLSLMGLDEETVDESIEVDQRTLLGMVEEAPVVVPEVQKEQVCTVRTRRGAEVVEIPIPCTN
jgi:pilus assembly protein CpaB